MDIDEVVKLKPGEIIKIEDEDGEAVVKVIEQIDATQKVKLKILTYKFHDAGKIDHTTADISWFSFGGIKATAINPRVANILYEKE